MSTSSPSVGPLALVGPGRMGRALAAALTATGADVEGPLGRGAVPTADVVLLCVPDAAIAEVAAELPVRSGRLVGHVSGASTLAPLAPHEAFSVHPLMTVPTGGATFTGATAAVAGTTPRALTLATTLAETVGMLPVTVADEDRAAYHASASVASNFLLTLLDGAEQLAATAGVPRERLAPLVRATVENWERTGSAEALTGPVARGDIQTVARQRAALADRTPEQLPLYDVMVERTTALARRGGR
ncbi:Rossmann-like and DUF2520 domain-containing protein [Desertihabitans aurantiacus]|uniref:Rossmann-like and DUF2520 domain-containing protein n=1 Tax=Desertihabitans aurantiacus TaxID=2282477 RepID=UPI0018E4E284|nr:DUF2520 domain-containing protein [Desertihabitans aurantiacus]